jgi:hypothetical protein
MLEELFRKAVQLGQKIATEDNVRFRELLDRVKELWTEYDRKPDASDRTIMGVDSGWNVRLYGYCQVLLVPFEIRSLALLHVIDIVAISRFRGPSC